MRYQFVDCRWELGKPERGRELYLEGHIPGASFLDVERDLSAPPGGADGGRHPLPSPEQFVYTAGLAGIHKGVFVIAYDQGMNGGAARLWWLLHHFGHHRVAVLDGGIDAWKGALNSGKEQIESVGFVPKRPKGDTISAEELKDSLGRKGLVLIDARSPERYRGELEPIDPVAGHIPGARNIPFTSASAIPPDLRDADEIVVYCGSGITACVDLLALARAGRDDAKLYPGSWSEWSTRGLPVERG